MSWHLRCTGYIDEHGHRQHDGDTCPIHESGLRHWLIALMHRSF